jgi:hypothetical protein
MHTSHYDLPLNTQKTNCEEISKFLLQEVVVERINIFLISKQNASKHCPQIEKNKPWESPNGDLLQNIEENETKQDAKCLIT